MANNTPFTGRGTSVGIGLESTWGTPVARSNWMRLISANNKRNIEKIVKPHLGTSGATSANRREFFIGGDDADLALECVMAYDDSSILLATNMLGAVATTGAGPYTHTVTLASDAQTGLTLEGLNGNAANSEVFEGCLVATWQISIEAGSFMRASANFIAQTSAARAAKGTPTYSSNGEEILHHHGAPLSFNSATYDVRSMTLSGDNKLARRRFIGSKFTQKPVQGDFGECLLEVTIEHFDDVPYAALLADTQGDVVIVFTGTGNNALTITGHNALLTDVSTPINSAGVMIQTLTFKLFSDGTDEGVKLEFVNDNATSTAN